MNRSTRVALALLFTAASLGSTGCQSQDRPIGSDEPGPDDEGSSAAALLLARWEGYVENYNFPSGTDVIQIDIDTVEGTSIQGKVRFGGGAPVPPPVDPDVGYGPSTGPNAEPEFKYNPYLPHEGFDFTILDAQLTDRRLLFTVDPRELWTSWCELQTSYPMTPGGDNYMCMPNEAMMSGPDGSCILGDQPTDCGYIALCRLQVCNCDASGCTVDRRNGISFDVAVDGQEANGSVAFGGPLYNVRLTRDP
ncbi:hypothetical protein ACMHYB_01805 [Sorangium sp. So ce1128]